MTPRDLFLAHLDHIKKVASHTSQRLRFSREEAEDFTSWVCEKLIEDDYADIRKYRKESSFPTYLTTVIKNLGFDYQNRLRGKWRPSAVAEQMGPLAVLLDQMLTRDRKTLDEVYQTLRTNHHLDVSREELAEIAGKLPQRNLPRRMEGEVELEPLPAGGLDPEEALLGKEKVARRKQVLQILRKVLATLPAEDGLIARMRGQFQVVQIAKTLKLEQKPLYRRIEKIFQTLRTRLEEEGVRADEVAGLLGGAEEEPDGPERV